MGDAEFDVVDHRGQRVEIGSVLPPQDRIGERAAIDVALAAHHVGPADGSRIEAKTPVRLAAGGLERGALVVGQAQGGAVVDRRAAERLLALAAAVELLRRLIGRVEPAQRLEFFGGGVVKGHPLRLAADEIGLERRARRDPPRSSAAYSGFERSTSVSSKRRMNVPPVAAGEQPVEQSRAGVSDVNAPGRRGRKTDDRRPNS